MINPNVKQFPADKNYILKEVQASMMDSLLKKGTRRALDNYLRIHNPLGLRDAVIDRIESFELARDHALDEFYVELAAIFRFLNHGNQLELIFDGRSHYDVFAYDWEEAFLQYLDEFSQQETFLKAYLGATVYYPGPQGGSLVGNRLKSFLNKHFQLKVYKHWGVKEYQVA